MREFIIKRREKKEYEQFTCRIEVGLLDDIRKIVLENNLNSINEFVNECIKFALENIKFD